MTETKKPMISTGSMLNSSEGIIATGALAALTQQLTTTSDPIAQVGLGIAIAILAVGYGLARGRAKSSGADA